jgi:hypothetical protein
MNDSVDSHSPIIPGRACGTCTLCCKVLKVKGLNKEKGQWCTHCSVGKGCKIYVERPAACRDFYCGYLTQPELTEAWKPQHSKLVLVAEENRLAAHMDSSFPNRWRDEPFYSQLKRWAFLAAPSMGQVVVVIGKRVIVILPAEDVDLGAVEDDELIFTRESATPTGPKLRAFKIHRDDPLARHLVDHKS